MVNSLSGERGDKGPRNERQMGQSLQRLVLKLLGLALPPFHEIPLVENKDRSSPGIHNLRGNGAVLTGETLGGVRDQETKMCSLQSALGDRVQELVHSQPMLGRDFEDQRKPQLVKLHGIRFASPVIDLVHHQENAIGIRAKFSGDSLVLGN